jgi:hypothetical protein
MVYAVNVLQVQETCCVRGSTSQITNPGLKALASAMGMKSPLHGLAENT